jgi:hypothetical protein
LSTSILVIGFVNKRPLPVNVISWIYIAAGVVGFGVHAKELITEGVFQTDAMWLVLVPFLAMAAGVYMLRGRNWARWLAVAWMAFHVVLSAFHSAQQLAVHAVMLALFVYFLFRPEATAYFRAAQPRTP